MNRKVIDLLKRGFKSQCERRSVEIRRSLDLDPLAPLSALRLAKYNRIRVWAVQDIDGLTQPDILQLTKHDKDSWSAFALRKSTSHLVVFNPSQSDARINSVVMHELSHILLGHELSLVVKSDEGHLVPANYDQNQEDEANWLAGTLLLPRPALLDVRRKGIPDRQVIDTYLVSNQMYQWRVRMTGVDYQISNSSRF